MMNPCGRPGNVFSVVGTLGYSALSRKEVLLGLTLRLPGRLRRLCPRLSVDLIPQPVLLTQKNVERDLMEKGSRPLTS